MKMKFGFLSAAEAKHAMDVRRQKSRRCMGAL
jgi:hypothetical protein